MLEIIFIIALVSLVIGSISDLKTYEIPDWLNFSLIAVGVGVNAIYSLSTQNYIYIIECLVGLAFSVALAYLMFYTGQWGGGDSKMIMGLGAIIGLPFKITYMSFLSYFYINIAFIGALYGFIWIISYLLFNLKKVFKRT
ncbi:hypothetical protein HOD20_05390, partial [archaeon]|nr:hypothetical protein [archaeon]